MIVKHILGIILANVRCVIDMSINVLMDLAYT